jgi:hypothetical protein
LSHQDLGAHGGNSSADREDVQGRGNACSHWAPKKAGRQGVAQRIHLLVARTSTVFP